MLCTKCGEEFADSQSFCPFCGAINTSASSTVKKPAASYAAPRFDLFATDTVYENPNKAYDNKATEFYRPHNLPHSSRNGSRRHRRRRRKHNKILRTLIPIIAVVFFLTASYFAWRIASLSRSEVNIKGRWVATADSGTAAGYVYTFTNDGFVTVKKSIYETSQNGTKYCWAVAGQTLTVDETLYISNTNDDGYKVLERIVD